MHDEHSIRRATAREVEERNRLTWSVWGGLLSLEQYLARETRLRAHPFSAGFDTWLLLHGAAPVASCETYRMASFVVGVAGAAFGIASVFVEAQLRGRGYARRLLEGLHATLEEEASPHAFLLFSEVGAELYARVGYQARSVAAFSVEPELRLEGDVELFSDLQAGDVLAALVRPRDRFVVWPTIAQLDWHRERQRIYAEVLHRPSVIEAGARDRDGAIFWAADWKNATLYATLIAPPSTGTVRSLIQAAQHIAAKYGLLRVVGWQGGDGFGAPHDASDSLAMLRPVAPGVRAAAWTVMRGLWI